MAAVATSSAAARTLAVPELLENVLLFCDPIQLFALQRVDTMFKDSITNSKHIKKRMLLDPEHVPTLEEACAIFYDARIKRALFPFLVHSVFDGYETRTLRLEIERDFEFNNRFEASRDMEWYREDHPLLNGQQSWRDINFTSPYENSSQVHVIYSRPGDESGIGRYCGKVPTFSATELGLVVVQAKDFVEAIWERNPYQRHLHF